MIGTHGSVVRGKPSNHELGSVDNNAIPNILKIQATTASYWDPIALLVGRSNTAF